VLADTIVTTVGVVLVAWIGARQEMVRRELARRNGDVEEKLQAIHENLLDNPTATSISRRQREAREDADQLHSA
jgi:hypothetical protein